MLNDQENEQIYQEELYRREIRLQLQADKRSEKWNKLWNIINSGVFIWFLSSIVIGSASFFYSRWEKEKEKERDKRDKEYIIKRENQHMAHKLDAEITGRLVYFNNLLEMREQAFEEWREIRSRKPLETYDLSKLVVALESPNTTDYPKNVIPEFSNRNLRSLVWELMQVVPQEDSIILRPVYEKTVLLQKIYLKTLYGNKRDSSEGLMNAFQARALLESAIAAQEFYTTFNLPRWGSVFTDLINSEADTTENK